MRILMAMLVSMIVLGATAQTQPVGTPMQSHLAVPSYPNAPFQTFGGMPSFYFSPVFVPFDQSARRWQIVPYASVSAGYIFTNGGLSYLSAPMGVALVRPLNNNVAAYTNLSVAPTVFGMSSLFAAPGQSAYPGTWYGYSTRVEGGLIYTNDARTFSISGGISVERENSFLFYQPAGAPSSYRLH